MIAIDMEAISSICEEGIHTAPLPLLLVPLISSYLGDPTVTDGTYSGPSLRPASSGLAEIRLVGCANQQRI